MRRPSFSRSSALLVLTALAAGLFSVGCSPTPAPEPPPASTVPIAPPPGAAEGEPGGETPPAGTTVVVGKDACKTDDDCVPATCCQPEACVAASKGPDCSTVRCMRDCSKPTTVCGGGCLCQNGLCAAKLGTTP